MPAQPPRSEPRADADVPALVSLYCGAGGLDIGFSRAGFDHLVALDSSPAAVRSWNHNLGSEVGRTADLDVDADLEGIVALTRGRQVGILGGPPCQGFSRARSNGVADDPRLRAPVRFAEICTRVAQEADVAFVVLENVDALLADRHADVVEEVTGHLTGIGLSVGTLVLQALDHGVAQRRSRAFLVATPVTGAEPQRSGADTATVRDVIEALPCPEFNTPDRVPVVGSHHANHVTSRPKSDRFRTGTFNRWRSFRRLDWDQPSPTVAYGNREIHVHPDGDRRLSVYEAMLLQGFDHEHRLFGTFSEQVQQVSNAVPPPLGEAVARAVADALTRARVGGAAPGIRDGKG